MFGSEFWWIIGVSVIMLIPVAVMTIEETWLMKARQKEKEKLDD